MEIQNVIMVQIANWMWTHHALQYACKIARQKSAKIALIKFVPVQYLSWLGTEFGNLTLSDPEYEEIADYQMAIEDEGVEFSFTQFQYTTLADAIVQAAQQFNAQIVFATLPKSSIPFWQSYQLKALQRHLSKDQRLLIEGFNDVRAPSVLTEEMVVAV